MVTSLRMALLVNVFALFAAAMPAEATITFVQGLGTGGTGAIATSATVIELNIEGTVAKTLIREIQRHPFKRHIMHIDFQELVAGETVSVRCPISYVGVPDGVRHEGGLLDQILHELHIEVDPSNIPNHIDVDITHLKLGKSMHVSDLKVGAGIKLMDDPDTTICIVQAPKAAVEAVVAEPGAPEPELIRKAKPDDEK